MPEKKQSLLTGEPTLTQTYSPSSSPTLSTLYPSPVPWMIHPLFGQLTQEQLSQLLQTALGGLQTQPPQIDWGRIMRGVLLSSLIPAGAGLLTGLATGWTRYGATPGAQVFTGLSSIPSGVLQGALTRANIEQQRYAQQMQDYWNRLQFLMNLFTPYIPPSMTEYERQTLAWRREKEQRDRFFRARQQVISELQTSPDIDYFVISLKRKDLLEPYLNARAYIIMGDDPTLPEEERKQLRKIGEKELERIMKEIEPEKKKPETKKSFKEWFGFMKGSPPPQSPPPSFQVEEY